MIRELEKKVYDINKVFWHARNYGQLDHVAGRHGIRLSCLALFNAAPSEHHLNKVYMKSESRKRKKKRTKDVLENYVRGIGCKRVLYFECYHCAMPKIEKPIVKDLRGEICG